MKIMMKSIKLMLGIFIAISICTSMLYSRTIWVDTNGSNGDGDTKETSMKNFSQTIREADVGDVISAKGRKLVGESYVITKNITIVNRWGASAENFIISFGVEMPNFTDTVKNTIDPGGSREITIGDINSDLKLWLDASQGTYMTKDGSNRVSQWQDLSGNRNHANETLPDLPTFLPETSEVDLRTGSLDINLPGHTSQDLTIFFVYHRNFESGFKALLHNAGPERENNNLWVMDSVITYFGDSDRSALIVSGGFFTFPSGVSSTLNIVVIQTTAAGGTSDVNGTNASAGPRDPPSTEMRIDLTQNSGEDQSYTIHPGSRTRIGGGVALSSDDTRWVPTSPRSFPSGARLSEFIMFYSALGAEDIKAITYYLSKKWRLESRVDSDGDTIPDGEDPAPMVVNQAPTNISLNPSRIEENAGSNEEVGTLSATDPEDGSMTYSFVSGSGATDNGSFNISGTTLIAKSSFDHETKSSYSIRLEVTDSGGLTYQKQFTINVDDVSEDSVRVVVKKGGSGRVSEISGEIYITNITSTPINVNALKIRYYYKFRSYSTGSLRSNVWYAHANNQDITSQVNRSFSRYSSIADSSGYYTHYIEFTIDKNKSINRNQTLYIQFALHKSDWRNDLKYYYSNSPTGVHTNKITVYKDGQLISGEAP